MEIEPLYHNLIDLSICEGRSRQPYPGRDITCGHFLPPKQHPVNSRVAGELHRFLWTVGGTRMARQSG